MLARRSTPFLALLATLMALITATPAAAVLYGEPDGDRHPYVGLVVLLDDKGTPLWRCSGTLISPTTFLTAAHCTEAPAATANVYFAAGPINPDRRDPSGTFPIGGADATGVPVTHPSWSGALTLPATYDLGLVQLGTPVLMDSYARLPAAGQLDGLARRVGQQDVSFTVVGYGLQGVVPEYSAERTRYVATTRVVNLRSALTNGYNVQLSSNPGHWSGGVCFGDSGGPIFLGDSRTIVAVTSFALNDNCKGADFGYRLDTADSLSFIAQRQ